MPWLIAAGCAGCNAPAKRTAANSPASEPVAASSSSAEEKSDEPDNNPTTLQVAFRKPAPVAKVEQKPALAGTPGLTLPELLLHAVENNPKLAAARTKAAAHGWKVPQVTSLDDPMVSSTVFLDSIQTAGGAQDVIVTLSQKFPWFGKRKLRGEIASADAQSLGWEAESVRLEIIEQVQRAYFDLVYLSRAHDVLTKLEPKIEAVVTVTRTKFRTGNDAKKRVGFEAVLQAEVELYRLRTQLVEFEEARNRATARLKELLNRPQDQPLLVRVGNEDRKVPADLNPLLSLIDRCQPDLLARLWESQRDAAGIALSKKNYYPDMTVGLNWYGISNSGLSPVTNGDDAVAMTFGMNVPIYRRKLKAAECEARLRYATSRHRQSTAANRFRSEVAALHADARSHDRVLKVLNENIIRRARRAVDLSVQSWGQDRIEFQRVIDNYKELVRFEIALLQHQRAKNQSLASLERAIGCAADSWQQ